MPKAPKGIPREHPNAASSHMGDRCVAATSLRCCGGTPGDQDGRGTNELSKIESILGTRMSQNLSRDRRLACVFITILRVRGYRPNVINLILLCHIMSCVRGAMWLSLTHCFIKVFYDDLAKFPLPPWKRPFSGSQITSTLILSHFRNFCHLAPAASVAHSTAISVDYSRHLVGACYA